MKLPLGLRDRLKRGNVDWTFLLPVILVMAIFAVAPFVLTSVTLGTLQRSATIGSSGIVKAVGVGVYWDGDCTNQVSSINWGTVEPDSVNNVTVYIRNESNAPVTLSLQAENWNPAEASNYMTLSWDYGGQEVGAGEVVRVMLSLSVSSGIEGITDFSFDIVIVGMG